MYMSSINTQKFNEIEETIKPNEEATTIYILKWCKFKKFNYLKHANLKRTHSLKMIIWNNRKNYASAVKRKPPTRKLSRFNINNHQTLTITEKLQSPQPTKTRTQKEKGKSSSVTKSIKKQ